MTDITAPTDEDTREAVEDGSEAVSADLCELCYMTGAAKCGAPLCVSTGD